MHNSSIQHMSMLIDRFAKELGYGKEKHVLDVGSSSLNGTYRHLFATADWTYVGLDLTPGPNVDVVTGDPYAWPLDAQSFDLVVSGQTLEHAEFFWLTVLEMRRVLRPGGMAFIIVPSRGPQHRHPVDCWRFYPDSFAALAHWTGMDLLWVNNPWQIDPSLDFQAMWEWGDCVGVLRNPHQATYLAGLNDLQAAISRFLGSHPPPMSQAPSVRIPKSRNSYLSTSSMLRYRFRKHMRKR